MMDKQALKQLLDEKAALYNSPAFIKEDPVQIPHLFTKKQDIEISGFFAATLAWGQRKTIIRKCRELMQMMDWAPHDFMLNYREADLAPFTDFKHRTFNSTDLFYFLEWFQWYYHENNSLEDAFARFINPEDEHTGKALAGFHELFFSLPESPHRTRKHVPTPLRNSSCKRLNMFLRWMVRPPESNDGVDFGIWKEIKIEQLLCPLDLHVERVARSLGLISRKQADWKTTLELTQNLKALDPHDPVRYDLALFGMGVMEK